MHVTFSTQIFHVHFTPLIILGENDYYEAPRQAWPAGFSTFLPLTVLPQQPLLWHLKSVLFSKGERPHCVVIFFSFAILLRYVIHLPVPGNLRVMGSGWMMCVSFNLLLQQLWWLGFFEFPFFHTHIRHLNVFEIKALIKSLVNLHQIIFSSLVTVHQTLLKPLVTLPDTI